MDGHETPSYSKESSDAQISMSELKPTANGNANGDANGDAGDPAAKSSTESDDGEKKEEAEVKMVGVGEVFRFADRNDKILIICGLIFAVMQGAAFPLMIIVFGNMSDLFIYDELYENWLDMYYDNISMYTNYTYDQLLEDPALVVPILEANNMTEQVETIEEYLSEDFLAQMQQYALYYTGIGIGVMLIAYIQLTCWQIASYRQCQRIRTELFRSILKQEIGWFDTHEPGELNTRLTDDVDKIQDGIGEKLGMFFQYVSAFFAGFLIGFIYGWQLTLVILAVSPLLMISGGIMAKLGATLTSKELKAYAKAGAVAEEVLSSIRTVTVFGGQNKEKARYGLNLLDARDFGIKKGFINGGSMGLVFFIMFGSYALAFWYGTQLFLNEGYSPGDILVVFFGVLIGAFSIGNASPNIQNFATARGAAHAIYEIIDMVPSIDSSSPDGLRPDDFRGNIEFKDVHFQYPSRPDVKVLQGLNLRVDVGQTVALVGSSGCGKSTTVQLLQRFYDVISGQILIDGKDIRSYNIKWLRQHIGVVSQEPVLFQTTIEENIRYGNENVTDEQIIRACRIANAHDFIMRLPKQYDTLVGERGAQLSGGQKQRIAIARALVRDPKILLLDEATSALDTESEASVQSALDKASEGRTTLVVAHRLSTVRNADQIAGFNNGVIVEKGTHAELMKVGGVYYTLCTNQSQKKDSDDDDLGPLPGSPTKSTKPFVFDRSISVKSTGSDALRKRTVSSSSATGLGKGTVDQETEEEAPPVPVSRILRLNATEWPFIVMGCIGAIVSGAIQPAFAIIFAEILGVFSTVDQAELEQQANFYSLMFLVIGAVAAIAMFTQSYGFARSGEYLTMRLREMTFSSYLRQDIAFYDNPRHNTGALCTRLATDATAVQGAAGVRMGTILQSLSAMGAGLAIGFIYSWQLTLLLLAFGPFMVAAGFIQMKMMTGNKAKDKDAMEEAGKVSTEAIENIRTVATLTKEDKFYADYYRLTEGPTKENVKRSHVTGISFGFSQGIVFFAYAACFSFGAWLIENGSITYEDMYKVVMAVAFSAMSIGRFSSFAPDYGKGMDAAARIFQLVDSEPTIDPSSEDGEKMNKVIGEVELNQVNFNYPTRPNIPVLRGIDLAVRKGQQVALVGSSGCGKSTVIQLVERFYDPHSGTVRMDGQPLPQLNIQWMRAPIGLVSQEPVLFDCSIADNIAYGDNSREVSMAEIIKAAKDANIHNFIVSLPEGYDTNVGDKGTQLSGGQKQRVAIARALIRNPKILLLDEATSALDTESEKVVQEALDHAQEGRTCITIAHRLSTIQNSDCILVIQNGQVVEQGTHSELISNKGFYYKLNTAQLQRK